MDGQQTGLVRVVDDMTALLELQPLARELALATVLVPPELREKPGDMLLALAIAKQVNLPIVFVLQSIHVIGGKAGFSSQFMIALANKSGKFRGPIRYDVHHSGTPNLAVTAYAFLAEGGDRVAYTVSLKMAEAEGWTRRNPKYRTMPEHMLRFRAAAFLIRTTVPEVLIGFYEEDEVRDTWDSGRREAQLAPLPEPDGISSTPTPASSLPNGHDEGVELTPDPEAEERERLIEEIRGFGAELTPETKREIMKRVGLEGLKPTTDILRMRELHALMEAKVNDERQNRAVLEQQQQQQQKDERWRETWVADPIGEQSPRFDSSEAGQTHTPTPAPAEERSVAPIPPAAVPATDPDMRKGNGETIRHDGPKPQPTKKGPTLGVEQRQSTLDAGIVVNNASFSKLGEQGLPADAFRAICREALGAKRLPEERYQSLLKAGEQLGHWHLTKVGATPWVMKGTRPGQGVAEGPRGQLAFEKAGEKLEEEVGDWELNLDQALDALETTESDKRIIFAQLRKKTNVKAHGLADQPRVDVLKYRDLLKAKAEELLR